MSSSQSTVSKNKGKGVAAVSPDPTPARSSTPDPDSGVKKAMATVQSSNPAPASRSSSPARVPTRTASPAPPVQKKGTSPQDFDSVIMSFLNSNEFILLLEDDVLKNVPDQERSKIVKAAVRCIFIGPRGVRAMPETKDYSHIKNNRNWLPFCKSILDYMKTYHVPTVERIKQQSTLYRQFGSFWPECNEQLAEVLKKQK